MVFCIYFNYELVASVIYACDARYLVEDYCNRDHFKKVVVFRNGEKVFDCNEVSVAEDNIWDILDDDEKIIEINGERHLTSPRVGVVKITMERIKSNGED